MNEKSNDFNLCLSYCSSFRNYFISWYR